MWTEWTKWTIWTTADARRVHAFFCLLLISLALYSCSGSSKPTLHLYCWANYIKPSLLARFEQEYQCRVVLDTYDSNEMMYAKLKAGAAGYDLLFPSTYLVSLMQAQGMLEPLDMTRLPNLESLDHELLARLRVTDLSHSIPYMISYTGVGYRHDRLGEIEPSWMLFSRRDLRGRMTLLNDAREALGAALKALDYSLNTVDPTQIQEATQLLLSWKPNLAKFENEQNKNGLASAEYLLVQGYSGDILQVIAEDPDVAFLIPEKGTMINCDHAAIPRAAPERDLAYAFLNFLYRPEVSAENMRHTFYVCPNRAAYPLLPQEFLENPALFPPDELVERSELILDVGPSIVLYNQAWETVKD